MDKQDFNKYFNAVDVVCINCINATEDNCEQCPVRITCDSIHEELQVKELKDKAEELGYMIVKKKKYSKPVRCICGSKPSYKMMYNGRKFLGYAYGCTKCERISEPKRYKYEAVNVWNSDIEEV